MTWDRGYLSGASLSYPKDTGKLAEVVEFLLHHPSGRLLRSLRLGFDGDPRENTLEAVFGAIIAVGPPLLNYLDLSNCDFTDQICELLVNPPLLPKLNTLILEHGTMSDDGAQILLEHRDRFAHLDSLDLSSNYLLPEDCEALSQICKQVEVHSQDESVADRYSSAGE